ncbi:unnamed protein product [Closterium sp. NIES-54]
MERYQKQHSAAKSMLSSKIWTCKRNDTRRRHQCPNLHSTLNDATTTTIGINQSQYLRSVTFARCQGILAHTALTDNSQHQRSGSFGLQAVKLPQRKRVRLLKYKPERHRRDNLRKEQETSTPRRESLQPNPTYAAIAQSEPSGKDTWFLDSCCGQHMCSSGRFVQREHQLQREVVITVANNQNLRTRRQGVVQLQSRETNVILQMSKVLIAEGFGYNLLSVSQLMAKGIHLEADSTTQEFKLYHGKGGLYIGKAVLKNNVFVLDFVPDLGTADSDGIVTFTSWTDPPDLDPNFSPEGFWYSHTIPEAERTRALATIQHPAAAETTSAAAETSATPTTLTPPVTSSSTTSPHIDNTSPTPAQQLTPTPREVHRSTNFTAAFYSNSDLAPTYTPLEKVYSDILYNREPRQGAYSYTITFIDAATRYVWHLNLPSKDMAFEAFIAWLPVAERESGMKLKSFQSDGGGEYTSQRFKQFLAEKGIKRLISLPYAHQQQGVAERMNRTLQNTMRKLLRGMRLPNHQWPEAMDHAVMLHNLLSSSSLPNNASPHLLWTGNQGRTKILRVFGCMVQYRPPSARADRFSQRAQWGLHLGIERNYNAWKIFDVHSKETVATRDVIFYERLTLPTYLANLEENRDPTGGFHGDRQFASAADEADWDDVNAETYFDLVDTGDEAAYPEDTTLPRYTQTSLQILGLVTAVHGTDTPKEPATVQQALGGEHREKWREAMDKELKALQERNTWKVVPIGVARNKTILTGKSVFHVKTKADGTIDKFKARWVVRGFDQEHGRDFTKTFAPVSRHTSLRILLAIAAMKKKKLRQIDVANAFLYALVDAEIFVELPHGSHGEPNQVCQLLKSLYGIKQAPRLWQQYLHNRLTRIGFRQLHGRKRQGRICSNETCWHTQLPEKAGMPSLPPVTCRPDLSYSASYLATYLKRPEDEHMKELDRALHYLDEIEKGRLELSDYPTSEMGADYLTKKLGKSKFEYCMLLTGQSHVTSGDTPEAKGSVGNN